MCWSAWGIGLHSCPVSAGSALLGCGKQTSVCACPESKSVGTANLVGLESGRAHMGSLYLTLGNVYKHGVAFF